MEFKAAVEKRASVRQFSSESIKLEDLREMVRLAGLAPSVNNSQPWKFIAITNRDLLQRMADIVHQKVVKLLPDKDEDPIKHAKQQVDFFSTFFAHAPAVFAVAMCPYTAIVDELITGTGLTHDEINAMRGYPDIQSLGAAIQTLILAATDMGYGTCWLSGPLIARQELEEFLKIQPPWHLAAMIAVGKPATDVMQRPKKSVEEIFEILDSES